MSKVTEIIKSLRAGGLSQSEIARRTGIPQSRVSRWEAGLVPGSLGDAVVLQDLAQQLGVAHVPTVMPDSLSIGTPAHIANPS